MTPLRVAVLAESGTDDAVAYEIVAHVRRVVVEPVAVPSIRTRGWPAVLRQLPTVVRTVYYQSDADALVILADTDATVPHDPATHTPEFPHPDCRWCALHTALARALAGVGPRPVQGPLRTAVGAPAPAVEAWLLAGDPVHASEAAWLQRGASAAAASEAYKRQLKQAAYGPGPPFRSMTSSASTRIRRALAPRHSRPPSHRVPGRLRPI